MSSIKEVKVEPHEIFVNSQFTLKVKAESKITWQELKDNFTWNTLKNYKFRDIGGNK